MGFSVWLVTFISFFSSTTFAAGVPTFSKGSEFTSVALTGNVTITCGNQTARYSCRESILEPATWDYFVGPENISADQLALSAASADVEPRTVVHAYASQQHRTSTLVNLWANISFSTPLLRPGANLVAYVFIKEGKKVLDGTLQILVKKGQARTCPQSSFSSKDPDECRAQFTVCQKYFEANNYCH